MTHLSPSLPGLIAENLPSKAATTKASSRMSGSIQHAAGEFEAILLNQWLEGAESSFASLTSADDNEDAGDAQMKSFAIQTLAKGLTAAGGVGLARLVTQALQEHPAESVSSQAKEKPK